MKTAERAPRKPMQAGEVFECNYPFKREKGTDFDGEGFFESEHWVPGVTLIDRGPEDPEAVADGIGKQVLSIVSTHKPGNYPERVFYTRKWRDPSGKEFGKNKLLVRSAAQFRALTKGYRHHFKVAVNA